MKQQIQYKIFLYLLLVPFISAGSTGINTTKISKENINFLDQIKISSKDNRPIVIFPQGTRTEPYERPSFKKGVVRIYNELNINCLPVTINSGEVWPKNGDLNKNKNDLNKKYYLTTENLSVRNIVWRSNVEY